MSRVAKKDALDIMFPNNFKTLESAMGKYTFFEDSKQNLRLLFLNLKSYFECLNDVFSHNFLYGREL